MDVTKLQEAIAFCRSEAAKRDTFADIEGALEVIGNMESATVTLQKQIDGLNVEIIDLVSKKASVESEAVTMASVIDADHKKRIEDFNIEIERLQKAEEDKQGLARASYGSELASLSLKREDLVAETNALSEIIALLNKTVSDLGIEIEGLEKKKSDTIAAIDQIKRKL